MNHYLALGDSYTIGEQVPIAESFPYQLVQLLRGAGWDIAAPEIVAKTGWTTDELLTALEQTQLLPTYDLVTLLIGVNNQYRGWSTETYALEFANLLRMAIDFAGDQRDRVLVLSIPDWAYTPFAEGRDRAAITQDINKFNTINKQLAEKQAVYYLDITEGTREARNNPGLLASDGLHPSGLEYARWARALFHYLSQKKGGSIPSARR